jgi:putative peptidoglycan lipid II flippase
MSDSPEFNITAASDDQGLVPLDTSANHEKKHRAFGFVQSTIILTISSVLRIALVFAQQLVLAAAFGAKMEMDAFLAATTIPTLITGVLIEQLNATLIPIVVKYKVKNGTDESRIVISSILNLAFIVLGITSLIGIFAGEWIIRLTVPGFGTSNPVFALTTQLFRTLLPSVIFSGLAGLLTGVFYAERRYLLTSVASILNCLLAFIITFGSAHRLGIMSAVIGLLVGSIAQFAVLFGILLKSRQYRFELNWRKAGITKILRLTMPLVGGALLYKASPVVDRFIASSLPEGSVAFLGYAFRIVNTLLILVTQGVTVAFFPMLSERAASEDIEGMKKILYSGIEVLTFIIAPIATALAVFGKPAVQLLLQRGAFTNEVTIGTTIAMLCYLGYLFAGTIGSIQTYALYSLRDTRAILKVAAIAVALEIPLSVLLSRFFGFPGLALSLSAVTMISMLLFFAILHRRLKGILNRRMFVSQSKVWLCCLSMAGISFGADHLLSILAREFGDGFGVHAVVLSISGVTGLATFLFLAWRLKCGGMHYLLKGFSRFRHAE